MTQNFRAPLTSILFVMVTLLCSPAFAAPAKQLVLNHKPLTVKDLGEPGTEIVTLVEVQGDRSLDHRVRLLAIIDGRVADIPQKRSYLNGRDVPTYEFTLHSPLAELSYQFLMTDPTGANGSTSRVTLRRDCIVSPAAASVTADPNEPLSAQIRGLAASASALNVEIQQLDSALRELKTLKELLAQ